jgi:gliding motility-associated transport system ATP-binding protein
MGSGLVTPVAGGPDRQQAVHLRESLTMIEVENLTKYYGSFLALDGVSFDVAEGDIVGILGPNGAGKTTLLRMLTCFMPATRGRARVAGFDIFSQSLQVREAVGYMPESVPLYEDMRVVEYLTFRGQLKGLDRAARNKDIERVMDRCQLSARRRQLIGTLSKGYRQRVGLAEAMLGDPKVLILDEPTIGLDPSQIREARSIVRDLGAKHTVLLSSHILHEVEQVCTRIIMIARGKIVANGRIDEIKQSLGGGGRTILAGRGDDADGLKRSLADLHGVTAVSVEKSGDGLATFTIGTDGKTDICEAVGQTALRHNWTIRELRSTQMTLEEFFIQKVAEQNLGSDATGDAA